MLFFLLFSRLFLSNRVITNLATNNKISKKAEGAWYYAKCRKSQNCTEIAQTIIKDFNISDISIIDNRSFTIFITKENGHILNQFQLKFLKIPKHHKINKNYNYAKINEEQFSYIIYSTESCNIPYNTTKMTSNYFLLQTNETFKDVSQTLKTIGCVRSFEILPQPRLNANEPIPTPTFSPRPNSHTISPHNFEDITDFQQPAEDRIFPISSSPSYRKLISHGLGGDGQVVSIVDTGLDANLCWFFDPERPIEYEKMAPSDHRKIQGYFVYADNQDIEPGGHGTFIAGIIAGSAICDVFNNDLCPGTYFDGVAPNAKILVNDIFTIKKKSDTPLGISKSTLLNEQEKKQRVEKPKILSDESVKKKNSRPKKKFLSRNKEEEIHSQNNVNNDDNFTLENYFEDFPLPEVSTEEIRTIFPRNFSNLFDIPSKVMKAGVQYHGFDFQDKSLFTSLIDSFAYENPELLLVFPAGDIKNQQVSSKLTAALSLTDGEEEKMIREMSLSAIKSMKKISDFSFSKSMLVTSTVSSPGDSKNVLTVGANKMGLKTVINEFDDKIPIRIINNGKEYLGYCDTFFGTSFLSFLTDTIKLQRNVSNEELKYNYFDNNYSFVIGKDVFIESNVHELLSHQLDQYQFVIVFNSHELKQPINKPIIRLSEDEYRYFKIDDAITIKFFDDTDSFHLPTNSKSLPTVIDNSALFSESKTNTSEHADYSRSNLKYHKRKPDIYMPGGPVYGPKSHSSSSLQRKCNDAETRIGEGTSVAAAIATGEILLLQQYLKQGFYVESPRHDQIETTSHMIRAILSNIAIDDDYFRNKVIKQKQIENNQANVVDFGTIMRLSPDKRTPQLEKFCLFEDDYDMNKTGGIRFFSDRLKSNSFHVYSFHAQFDGTLKISIAWNDPPHDPFAPSDVLFKLDVRIESVSTGTIYGDLHYDPFNVVKDYVLPGVTQGEKYRIYVQCGDNLFYEYLNYTIVISGPFDHFNKDKKYVERDNDSNIQAVKCLYQCQGKSTCSNGFCVCPDGHYGDDCSKEMIRIYNQQTTKDLSLAPHDMIYLAYIFHQWKPGSKLTINFIPKDQNGNEITNNIDLRNWLFLMFSVQNVPTWLNANCNSDNCQWATIQGNSLIMEYHFWDFARNGDSLYLLVQSMVDYPCSFDVQITEYYR